MHQHSVLIDQGHHVGHSSQGGQPDGLQQEIAHPRADFAGPAGLLAQGPGQLEGHARAAQVAERIAAAGQAGMDDGRRLGQLRRRLVVIGDDQLQAELAGQGGLFHGGDAAIDRDQHRRLAVAPGADGLDVQPISFLDAMGHIVADLGPQHLQTEPEDRRAGNAVDVIVAVDHDPPPGDNRLVHEPHRLGAAGQKLRIAQRRKLGIEEGPRGVRIGDAATDEQLGHYGRDACRSLSAAIRSGSWG